MLKDDFGFAVVCKKTQTLGDILSKKGRKVEQQYRQNTVYSIPCKECPMKYIGQTSVPRGLKKKCKEHENWCRKKHKKKLLNSTTKNDGIAYHHHLTGHEIDFENTRILAEETSYWPRLIIEGLEIKKLQPTVRANMQAGYEIDPIWDIYLGALKS